MLLRSRLRASIAMLVLVSSSLLSSCLTPIIPIPPPVALAISSPCVDAFCTESSRIVHIHGRTIPGALVVAINRSRTLANGSPYMASTIARLNSGADAGADGGIAGDNFELDLIPVSLPGQPTVSAQVLDEIEVYALSAESPTSSDVRRSQSAFISVMP